MRAVIIATGGASCLCELGSSCSSPMLPVGDRPILQHIIETLVTAGFRRFDLVLGESAHQVEHHFGEGQRWGCSIRYHLTSGFEKSASLLLPLASKGEPLLVAQGDLLPRINFKSLDLEKTLVPMDLETAAGHGINDSGWSGWAWFPAAASFPTASTWTEIWQWLRDRISAEEAECVPVRHGLSTREPAAYLASQQTALTELADDLHFAAFRTEPGVWIGRNVSLPKTVEIIPPVLIGDDSQIGRFTRLGPCAVIAPGSLVDENSRVENSIVLPGSYVGRHLTLDHAIVNHHRLLNVRLGAALAVQDAFILGRVTSPASRRGASGVFGRIASAIIFGAVAPILLAVSLGRLLGGRRPAICWRDFVETPAPESASWVTRRVANLGDARCADTSDGWAHFFRVFLPGLPQVALGHLALVGPAARTADELRSLPADWQETCLQAKAGLLTEWFVHFGPHAGPDERYASEAFCAAAGDWRMTLRVLGKYAGLLALGRPHPEQAVGIGG